MSANIEMFLLTRFVQKWGLEIPSTIFEYALIFGPYQKSLHSYLDPSIKNFALLLGPFHGQVCTHIWTLLWPCLHSYLDLSVMKLGAVHKEGDMKSSFFGSPPTRTNFWGVAIARGWGGEMDSWHSRVKVSRNLSVRLDQTQKFAKKWTWVKHFH